MKKFIGFLRLTRPANLVTAVSDILAGIAIAVFASSDTVLLSWQAITLLVTATIGLYGGGVVFNDVFDAELDKAERPERPISSGLITKRSATILGTLLLLGGVVAAAAVHKSNPLSFSTLLAVAIAICAIVYDKWMKHNAVMGPLNMGVCRGLNLLLGMSLFPILTGYEFLAIVPVFYIAAITMVSRGEVHGGRKTTLYGAAALYVAVITGILAVGIFNGFSWGLFAYVVLFAALIFPPLIKAIRNPTGAYIGKAVKSGVIALIVMNAAWAAAFGMVYFALVIVLLLPVSVLLAKLFAVT